MSLFLALPSPTNAGTKDVGELCVSATDCVASAYCDHINVTEKKCFKKITAGKDCDIVYGNASCVSGFCKTNFVGGTCSVDKLEDSQLCAENGDCVSGSCAGNVCGGVKRKDGQLCYINLSCESDNCKDNICGGPEAVPGYKAPKTVKTTTTSNEKVIDSVTPILAVPLPGLSKFQTLPLVQGKVASVPWIAQYIGTAFSYGVTLAGVLAVIMILIGGIMMMSASISSNYFNTGKTMVTYSISGLVLIMASYIILVNLNPRLTQLPTFDIGVLEEEPLILHTDDEENRPSQEEAGTASGTATVEGRKLKVADPENLCFPIKSGYAYSANNWGQSRKKGGVLGRCHQGLDLITKGRSGQGTVVAISDGVVLRTSKSFTTCRDGKTTKSGRGSGEKVGAITVYDEARKITFVYGEINVGTSGLQKGEKIKKGQKIGIASKCLMLHLEAYEGKGRRQGKRKFTYMGKKTVGWAMYEELNLPALKKSRRACTKAPYIGILDKIESKLIDPTPLMKQIKKNKC